MIDQPKPTFEHDDSDMDSASIPAPLQPKPTTGEWTEGKVFSYFESEDFVGLAKEINAALDAEREKREKAEQAANHNADISDSIARASQQVEQQLRSQLAAAQAAIKNNNDYVDSTCHGSRIAYGDTTALAAAIAEEVEEATKPLRDLLQGTEPALAEAISAATKDLRQRLNESERNLINLRNYRLAAAQQPLVDALTKLLNITEKPTQQWELREWTGKVWCAHVNEICKAAFAKVKEGK